MVSGGTGEAMELVQWPVEGVQKQELESVIALPLSMVVCHVKDPPQRTLHAIHRYAVVFLWKLKSVFLCAPSIWPPKA